MKHFVVPAMLALVCATPLASAQSIYGGISPPPPTYHVQPNYSGGYDVTPKLNMGSIYSEHAPPPPPSYTIQPSYGGGYDITPKINVNPVYGGY